MTFLVDSHCHLNMLQDDRSLIMGDVIAEAENNNVKIINNIGTAFSEFEKVYATTQSFKNVYCSLGIHPEEIKNEGIANIEKLREWCLKDKVIGIGESGLDYHYDDGNDKIRQKRNFEIHIELAREIKKPLIIHSREADADMMEILKSEMKNGEFKFLLHSFTSGKELCYCGLDLGGYISLSGIVTFKNASGLREIVKDIPLNRILLETDAPFLAPVPYRGQTNKPCFIRNIAEYLGNFFSVSFSEIQNRTTNNFLELFNLQDDYKSNNK